MSLRVAAGLLISSIQAVFSETVFLRPIADTTLFESSPNDNMGGWTHAAAGTTGTAGDRTRNRALFRFDVAAALPSQAQVTNAILHLEVVRVPGAMGGGSPASSNFVLRRVLKPWGEGDKLGDRGFPADPGEATWNDRFAPGIDGEGRAAWSAPGAAAPGDFSSAISASRLVSGQGKYQFGSTSNLVADVQDWLDHPSSNFGWILISQSENIAKTARGFGSREDTDHPPILAVEYSAPVPLRIDLFARTEQEFQFSFRAEAGHSYAVQFRSSLSEGAWSTLTNLNGQTVSTNVVVQDPLRSVQRFYRVGKF